MSLTKYWDKVVGKDETKPNTGTSKAEPPGKRPPADKFVKPPKKVEFIRIGVEFIKISEIAHIHINPSWIGSESVPEGNDPTFIVVLKSGVKILCEALGVVHFQECYDKIIKLFPYK